MSVKRVLKAELERIQPDEKVVRHVKRSSDNFNSVLKKELANNGFDVEIFVGGSFAKKTLLKKDKYDVDTFIRFDWRYDNISDILEKSLRKVCRTLKINFDKIHGSRDYFRVYPKDHDAYFELIPVAKIKKPEGARNVTDLSYFHVSYVRKKIKNLEDQVRLTKRFMEAQKVYGAESYVQGFSGYAIECLIIHYKSFEKMIRELSKIKKGERTVIDIEKHYKRKNDVLFEMNESKLHSPIVLVDPTFPERNALASLSKGTFEKFQESIKKFLKTPSVKFFEKTLVDPEKLKKTAKTKKADFIHLKLKTDRQEGDIAGTKMKKFHNFMITELSECFEVIGEEFEYDEEKGQESDSYLICKARKEVIRVGPPVSVKGKKRNSTLEKHIAAFKRAHSKVYEKNGILHAKIAVNVNLDSFLKGWFKDNKEKIKEMGIIGFKYIK